MEVLERDHILVDVMNPDLSPDQRSSDDGVEFSKVASSHMKTIQEEDSLESQINGSRTDSKNSG